LHTGHAAQGIFDGARAGGAIHAFEDDAGFPALGIIILRRAFQLAAELAPFVRIVQQMQALVGGKCGKRGQWGTFMEKVRLDYHQGRK